MKIIAMIVGSILLYLVQIPWVYSWNRLGHRLIAQIAYDHLNASAKQFYNDYNHRLDVSYRHQSFVDAAAWLDSLRYMNQLWMGSIHYIDLPFSTDQTPLGPINHSNAVTAIEQAKAALLDPRVSKFNKGFSFRILLHVVGDLHQPLHAANRFSKKHPAGDRGGNLFLLRAHDHRKNLHTYWDQGGGFLLSRRKKLKADVKREARWLEKQWPCQNLGTIDPMVWAKESFNIAVQQAYALQENTPPPTEYRQMVRYLTKQRLALAGCRLANLLNALEGSIH